MYIYLNYALILLVFISLQVAANVTKSDDICHKNMSSLSKDAIHWSKVIDIKFVQGENLSQKKFNKAKKRIIKNLENIFSFVPQKFWPTEMNFIIGDISNDVYHNVDTIGVAYQFLGNYNSLKHPSKSKIATIHEIGHDIFDEIMKTVDPRWSRSREIVRELFKTQEALKQLQEENQSGKLSDQDAKRKAENIISHGKELFAEQKKNSDKIKNLYSHLSEFFSDLVVILSSQNKRKEYDLQAVKKLLYSSKAAKRLTPSQFEKAKRRNEWRDFEVEISIKDWWTFDYHLVFNPARGYLGKNYLTKQKWELNRKVLFEKLVLAYQQTGLWLKNHPESSADQEKINEIIMEKFDEFLK